MLETVLSRSVRLIYSGGMVIGLGLIAQPALAQQAAGETQRVEITGSNIRRAEAETASPVQTLTRQDIERSGKATVAELLQTLAVDNQGSVPMSFGAGFAGGASGISLRGLGAASTLVLINGRRVAPFGLADDGQKVFTDINIIPVEAVERVEILKDGSSAIYGSDAIAGVVNVILRKDFVGSVAKVTYGQSRYHDGRDVRAAMTHGFGNLDEDKFNILFNFEYGKKGEIWNRDRAGRDNIGRTDRRDLGFDANGFVAGVSAGGIGAILDNNLAGNAINGNVRNPTTLDYFNRGNLAGAGFTRTFPGAACSNLTSHPQGDPLGGCLIDAQQQYSQVQPSQETFNFFTRGTKLLSGSMQAYGELNLYNSRSQSSDTPSSVSSSVGFPGGPVSNAATQLGAAHPDNPYFGTAARLRYLSADVGPRVRDVESTFARVLAGLKGTIGVWDYDTAFLHSENRASSDRTGFLRRDVMNALLNPTQANIDAANAASPAFRALGSTTANPVYWRIGENAGLNSRALYQALSPTLSGDAKSQTTQADFKVSREVGQLAGGAMQIALGTEARHESVRLDPVTGTDTGNIVGLGYSAYSGSRNVYALYGEVLAPVLKPLELSAALRADHYSDVGNSYTPKLGAKFTPIKQIAVRATYAEGFRAPSPAENGVGGLAAFSNASDPLRCNLGVASACAPGQVAIVTSPNRDLKPEKSKSATLGIVWDPLPKTSLSVDLWEIRRRNEINQENTTAAIAAGHVARDPSTASVAGDPGQITAVLARYVNSNQTTVRGVDLDFRQGFELGGGYGNLTFDAKWTHLFSWLRKEQDGTEFEFAGTHGNCDVTNCIGTPADRVNLTASWEQGRWAVATILNYRGALKNVLFENDPDGCASTLADGTPAPAGCKVKSFTTVDLTFRFKATEKAELFGGIQNLFDKIAPFDPLTYGATGYNPLDYIGAVGRFFSIGLRYKF